MRRDGLYFEHQFAFQVYACKLNRKPVPSIYPFQTTGVFPYHLKTSENQKFSYVTWAVESDRGKKQFNIKQFKTIFSDGTECCDTYTQNIRTFTIYLWIKLSYQIKALLAYDIYLFISVNFRCRIQCYQKEIKLPRVLHFGLFM